MAKAQSLWERHDHGLAQRATQAMFRVLLVWTLQRQAAASGCASPQALEAQR